MCCIDRLRRQPYPDIAGDDGDAIRAHLSLHGVDIGDEAMRYGAEGSGPSIYIRDPDGNTVELKGPPDE